MITIPHKIILTGMPIGDVRNLEKYYAFEMTEKGGPSAPKGIPFKSTAITYTIFVSNKQFKKLELDPEGFQHTKLLVQGEPTLDAPVDACPGETGVICMQIQVLPKKTDDKDKDAKQTDIKNKASQKTDTKSEDTQKKEYLPKGTEDVIPLDKIILGEMYQTSVPGQEKRDIVAQAIQKTGTIDQPILIEKETKVLKDGFSRYFVARNMKLERVPVQYVK